MIKNITVIILLLCTIPVHLNAADYDSFEAPNYQYFIDSDYPSNDTTAMLKKSLSNGFVFLYVSGCHLDQEALPAFQELTLQYPEAKFIRIDQHSSSSGYMLNRYNSFGAPKIYLMHNGNIISHVIQHFEQRGGNSKYAGWKESIHRWARNVYPHVKAIAKYRNIIPVTSFNYREIFREQKVVLMRTDLRQNTFPSVMKILCKIAARYPDYIFAFDTGNIPYNQEFTVKYKKAYNSFSVINNCDEIKSSFPLHEGKDFAKLDKWVSDSFGSNAHITPGSGKDADWLKKIIAGSDSLALSTISPTEFRQLNSDAALKDIPLQQSFYVILNAITDSRRNKETALLLIDTLRYDFQGGIKKVVNSPVMRQKVYAPIINRAVRFEDDEMIKRKLSELEAYYVK